MSAIASWYQGKYVPPAGTTHPFYGKQHYHWTARVVRAVVRFYLEHWKWLWPLPVGVAGVIAALKKA